jgi:lipopolysaccharide biosynthesis protein
VAEQHVFEILSDMPHARLFQFNNRGRDVMPFLKLFQHISPLGYRWICKLHSKKSLHREDGDNWRQHNFEGLLGSPESIKRIQCILSSGNAGIVAAHHQIHRSEEYWGSNKDQVLRLLDHAGLVGEPPSLDFVAGTMFWCRPEALAPLLRLPHDLSFEPEKGQIDGTLAHALERFISIAARAEGWQVIEMNELATPS